MVFGTELSFSDAADRRPTLCASFAWIIACCSCCYFRLDQLTSSLLRISRANTSSGVEHHQEQQGIRYRMAGVSRDNAAWTDKQADSTGDGSVRTTYTRRKSIAQKFTVPRSLSLRVGRKFTERLRVILSSFFTNLICICILLFTTCLVHLVRKYYS